MARDAVVTCAADTWTELSNADITAITLHNLDNEELLIACTASPSPGPDGTGSTIKLFPGETILNKNISDLFPGVSGGDRIFGKPWESGQTVRVSVSHA